MGKVLMAISTFGGIFMSGIIGGAIGIAFSLLYIKLALADKKNKVIPAFVGWVAIQAVLFAIAFMLA